MLARVGWGHSAAPRISTMTRSRLSEVALGVSRGLLTVATLTEGDVVMLSGV
jgi:hypothetical protein